MQLLIAVENVCLEMQFNCSLPFVVCRQSSPAMKGQGDCSFSIILKILYLNQFLNLVPRACDPREGT